MTSWKLILRSLVYHRRSHFGVFLGAMVGTATLVGALVVGDSVRMSLKNLALSRLGKTEFALEAGDRFFRAELAEDLTRATEAETAPILKARGLASSGNGSRRGNRIQVLGVDRRFWELGPDGSEPFDLGPDETVVNERLASALRLRPADEFLLRVGKAGVLPGDVPLVPDGRGTLALRLRVKAVASSAQMGRFSLRANQVPPRTAFLSLPWLAKKLGLPGRANAILVAETKGESITVERLRSSLRERWRLADAGLELREVRATGEVELRSERVFLDPPVEEAALGVSRGARPILSYFVNRIRCGKKATPYSFVSAPGTPLVPPDMADDEILINEWLAGDLGAGPGSSVTLTYFIPGPLRKLEEREAVFRVRAVVPIRAHAADPDLMPPFPGLSGVDRCSDWDPGLPIDLDLVRDQDEAYWDRYRGTPKAFVTLREARRLWENRFGALTAVRYPAGGDSMETIREKLMRELAPGSAGLAFRPVREESLRAGSESVDFGGLFLGLSFFLIVSAMLLTGLLFAFGVEQRAGETGTLLALGFSPARVRRLLLAEGALVVLAGGIAGTLGGIAYNRSVLVALGTLWRDAVGTSSFETHVRWPTLLLGAALGMGVSTLALWASARKQTTRSVHALHHAQGRVDGGASKKRIRISLAVALAFALGATAILVLTDPGRGREAAGAFFGAGALLLACGTALCHALLLRLERSGSAPSVDLTRLAVRNTARNRGRSLTTIAVLATGVFLVIAVGANRHDPIGGAGQRASGTGGFALHVETSVPVTRDLNTADGRKVFGLDSNEFENVGFVHVRVREGDDASCLNLNRVRRPRILGVDPRAFAEREAFTFEKTMKGQGTGNPWLALEGEGEADAIPAVADQTVITWGLGLSIGDSISYVDERGRPFEVKLVAGLANSIFQGNILISEEAFENRFPSVSGSRVILVDVPNGAFDRVAGILSKALADLGPDIQPAGERLKAFQAVENTYLDIFLLLGGLGLILGNAGMAVVVLRNVLERRRELALLRAVGFSRRSLRRMVLVEHAFLFAAGLACGGVAAVMAVLPALTSASAGIPGGFLAAVTAAMILTGLAWTAVATHLASRGDLLAALRSE